MNTHMFSIGALVLACSLALDALAAQRSFVATYGLDTNVAASCSTSSPCRGLPAALSVTDTGGEIVVLNSGGYGPVSIDKSVSIIAPRGVHAGIAVSAGDGLNISGVDSDVTLRGLSIKGLGGDRGIVMTSGKRLTVDNCTIADMGGAGLMVWTSASVSVRDSRITDNGGIGVHLLSGVTAVIQGTTIRANNGGLLAWSAGAGNEVIVEVSRSAIEGNSGYNLHAQSHNGAKVQMDVKRSAATESSNAGVTALASTGTATISLADTLIAGNQYAGLSVSGAGATLIATGNTVVKNGHGVLISDSGTVQSDGTNTLRGNTTAVTGSLTIFARM